MILCAGEALIDMLPGNCAGRQAFIPHPGGAVFNTAIALGRLGRPTALFTGLSRDLFGDLLREALLQSRVETGLIAVFDRPTTLAFVTLTEGQASYAFYDENTALRLLTVSDLPDLPPDVTALFFGGISLAMDPCASAFETLLARASADRVIMIDPNIRPAFIADETAFRARMGGMLARADIVKLSDEDLIWLMGPGPVRERARALLDLGPKLVFVTEGAKGAFALSAQVHTRVEAAPVRVADTVGAGDTFNAGILAALDRMGKLNRGALAQLCEEELLAALSLGARAAAVTVSRDGANPPWAEELS